MADRHYVRCKVVGNALAESKEKKTPSVHIRLQAIPGANPQLEGYAEDRTLWADLWITDNTIESTIETLEKVLGWRGSSFAELNEPILEGAEVDAACHWEEVNGKWIEKVDFLNSPGGGGVKKMDDAQVVAVVSRMDALLARARANNPAAAVGRAGGRSTLARTSPTRQTPPQTSAGDSGFQDPGPRGRNNVPDEGFFA